MSETLQEFVDSRGVMMRVDREQGVIRGVKVLGLRSRNGRTYLAEALERAVPLYEGAKVNVNHPKANPLGPRDYQDRIGNLRNVLVRADAGLFADFHFNPKHALAEQLVWDAEHAAENVGFSHNVLARTARRGDRTVVEAITKVQSVDLVADPATTRGLFESSAQDGEPAPTLAEATVALLKALRPDLVDGLLGEQAERLKSTSDKLAQAEGDLDRLRESEAQARREILIHRLLAESGLPEPGSPQEKNGCLLSERFLAALLQAPDEPSVRELIADRVALIESLSLSAGAAASRPRSRDQHTLSDRRPTNTKSFVQAIT
ncbi:MAG: hypothetical protein JW888_15620 [Pirellulales bacterium]|nr:hypothetical protein [Pirellulales bacterium]